mgnify:CR=1 FL=1
MGWPFDRAPRAATGLAHRIGAGALSIVVGGPWLADRVLARNGYRSQMGSQPVPPERPASLVLTRDHIDKRISARTIASANGYKKSRSTAVETGPVLAKPVVITRPSRVKGTPTVGNKLTVRAGSVKPTDATATYAWLRDGKRIASQSAKASSRGWCLRALRETRETTTICSRAAPAPPCIATSTEPAAHAAGIPASTAMRTSIGASQGTIAHFPLASPRQRGAKRVQAPARSR